MSLSKQVMHDANVVNKLTLSHLRSQQEGIKQSIIALMMNVQEPAISKLEKKRVQDVSVDKLVRYVNAIGGDVVLTITLPEGDDIVIKG